MSPSFEYNAKNCHLSEEAAQIEVGKSVVQCFNNDIMYIGEAVGVVSVSATAVEPANYLN